MWRSQIPNWYFTSTFLSQASGLRIYAWRPVVGCSPLSSVGGSVSSSRLPVPVPGEILILTIDHISRIFSPGRPAPPLHLPGFIKPRNFFLHCRNIKRENFSYLIFVKYKITIHCWCMQIWPHFVREEQTVRNQNRLHGTRLVSDYNNDRIILALQAAYFNRTSI